MCSACLVQIVCVCVLLLVDLFGVAPAVSLGYLVMLGVCRKDQWQLALQMHCLSNLQSPETL